MKFKLVESYLIEDELLEDKMVKFGGELSPKYGWCVIYIGGPGSGKGTATGLSVNLRGRKFDPDDLKNEKVLRAVGIWDDLDIPEEDRDLKNPDYVSALHVATEPLKQKMMAKQLNMGKNANANRLPNIIFDIVGSTSKFEEIIPTVKEMGYKVAIVWTLTDVQKAILQNQSRERHVRMSVVVDGHKKVINAVEQLFNSNMLKYVDDFWVIDNSNSVQMKKIKTASGKMITDPQDEYAYTKDTNVYHIKLSPDGFDEFVNIISQINKNKEYLDNVEIVNEAFNANSGYSGYSMSNRARQAYEDGEMPKSKWTKSAIMNRIKNAIADKEWEMPSNFPMNDFKKLPISILKDIALIKSSWHHTSNYFNKTDFYDVDFDFLSGLDAEKLDNYVGKISQRKAEKAQKEKQERRVTAKYLVWEGSRNHPKATEITADGYVKGNFFYPYGKDYKKSINANGFKIIKEL